MDRYLEKPAVDINILARPLRKPLVLHEPKRQKYEIQGILWVKQRRFFSILKKRSNNPYYLNIRNIFLECCCTHISKPSNCEGLVATKVLLFLFFVRGGRCASITSLPRVRRTNQRFSTVAWPVLPVRDGAITHRTTVHTKTFTGSQ